MTAKDSILFLGVGDVILGDPKDPFALFAPMLPTLEAADLRFGQNETSYSQGREVLPQARGNLCFHPRNIEALAAAGFDVMSACSNHSMDFGYSALVDTLDGLRDAGVATVGAGRNLAEAQEHVVLERNGVKVAFLAYSPASDRSFNAVGQRPGNNPMSVYTHYHEAEPDFPGARPKIFTFPDPDHVADMRASLERARAEADVVIVSFHWGLPFEPMVLARYESELGKICIDGGADLVIGHHQHLIKAVETYKGKVIFHGINHFIISIDYMKDHASSPLAKQLAENYGDNYHNFNPRSTNPFVADANQCLVVRAELSREGVRDVGFIPCVIDALDGTPTRARPGDGAFERILAYVRSVTAGVGMATEFEVIDDHVRVRTDRSPRPAAAGRQAEPVAAAK